VVDLYDLAPSKTAELLRWAGDVRARLIAERAAAKSAVP
jgi:hypothetical protein